MPAKVYTFDSPQQFKMREGIRNISAVSLNNFRFTAKFPFIQAWLDLRYDDDAFNSQVRSQQQPYNIIDVFSGELTTINNDDYITLMGFHYTTLASGCLNESGVLTAMHQIGYLASGTIA